jgi:hypothetical protein
VPHHNYLRIILIEEASNRVSLIKDEQLLDICFKRAHRTSLRAAERDPKTEDTERELGGQDQVR